MRKLTVFLACTVSLILAFPAVQAAQTGILAGTVTDLNGNGLAGITVSLYRGENLALVAKNPQTTIASSSVGPLGHYGFKDIPIGRYKLVVEKSLGPGRTYKAEQLVTVSSGTVVQDVVLVLPEPTGVPGATYRPTPHPADGFGIALAALAMAGAVLVLNLPGLGRK